MARSSNPIQYDEDVQMHRDALHTPLPVVAQEVGAARSFRMAAALSGLPDSDLIREWAAGRTTVRNPEVERRLRTAYEVLLLLRQHDGDEIIRAWFLGMDPTLNDVSPSSVIREGRFTDAIDAAHAFIPQG